MEFFIDQLSGDEKKAIVLISLFALNQLLSLIIHILASLAINFDAKAKGIKNRALFAVLGFFFPLIMAIVYLCLRSSAERIQPKICNICGITLDSKTKICPKCSGNSFTDYKIIDCEKNHKHAKSTAISVVVLYVLTVVLAVMFYVTAFSLDDSNYNDFYKYYNDYSYSNDADNFDNFEKSDLGDL